MKGSVLPSSKRASALVTARGASDSSMASFWISVGDSIAAGCCGGATGGRAAGGARKVATRAATCNPRDVQPRDDPDTLRDSVEIRAVTCVTKAWTARQLAREERP